MSTESGRDDIERTRARLRASRVELFELAHELKGDTQGTAAPSGFPRSRLMRAAFGTGGKVLLGSALLTLTVLRPKLVWRFLRMMPELQPLALRYLAHRFLS